MQKHKRLLIATVILFIIVNSAYFWESNIGAWAMLTTIMLFIYFLFLFTCLLSQIIELIKERLKDRFRIYLVTIMILSLSTIAFRPSGIVDFERLLEGKDLLIAFSEGVANCTTTIKLKENNKFTINVHCFGTSENYGTYTLNKDSLTLRYAHNTDTGSFTFGVIKPDTIGSNKSHKSLMMYQSVNDTTPIEFTIVKNDLKN